MRDQVTRKREAVATPWVAPLVAALVTWLLWRFGAEAVVFTPSITTTLLGISVAANVGLVTYLVTLRR